MKKIFTKQLSANDVGATGGHQGGILVPKAEEELLAFLPPLDPAIKNPDAWIECIDEFGVTRRLRLVYYNNKLHDPKGTRNEYRITYLTTYFRHVGAEQGDMFEISGMGNGSRYGIRIVRAVSEVGEPTEELGVRIKLSRAWHRAH